MPKIDVLKYEGPFPIDGQYDEDTHTLDTDAENQNYRLVSVGELRLLSAEDIRRINRPLNGRKMMERAIEEMRKSIPEQRDDGKVSPKVGAVLVHIGEKPPQRGPRIVTAFRGELRDGDHAEFTLLERKCRDIELSDCVLFATLEPCAPGARRHPKLGCAERIVLARIKQVWIGIEDPDPTVARKGIEHLQKNGVEVHMFDRDLQDKISQENESFLKQAQQRAEEASQPKEVVLSPLEGIPAALDLSDLSPEALEWYRTVSGIQESVESGQFRKSLLQRGILKLEGAQYKPSGFGNILFGKSPRVSAPQASLLATIYYPNGEEEVKDFDGPQVFVPREVEKWLRDKLPNIIDRGQAVRAEKSDPLFELIREGIVNALVHRDYSIEGAKCQLRVHPNKIEILSPGLPVKPITVEQVKSLDAPMLSRNPVLHFVFAQLRLAEERGLGLRSMRTKAIQAGLPLPQVEYLAPYLILTLHLTTQSTSDSISAEARDKLNETELSGLQWLATVTSAQSKDYAQAMNVDPRTARRHLKLFVDLGLAIPSGSGPTLAYKRK